MSRDASGFLYQYQLVALVLIYTHQLLPWQLSRYTLVYIQHIYASYRKYTLSVTITTKTQQSFIKN